MLARKLIEPIILGVAPRHGASGTGGLTLQRGPATNQSGAEDRGCPGPNPREKRTTG